MPLAQRCSRLGRYVVGVGVAGSTAKSLAAACDEFEAYDSLPGVPRPARVATKDAGSRAPSRGSRSKGAAAAAADPGAAETPDATPAEAAPVDVEAPAAPSTRTRGGRGRKAPAKDAAASETAGSDAPAADSGDAPAAPAPAEVEASLIEALGPAVPPKRTNRRASSTTVAAIAAAPEPMATVEEPPEDPQEIATRLLERALRLGQAKDDDAEWLHSSAVKTHMRRMDPSFSEKALGYRSFSDFVKARESIAELEETGHERLVRLRE